MKKTFNQFVKEVEAYLGFDLPVGVAKDVLYPEYEFTDADVAEVAEWYLEEYGYGD